jgi:hypothetical protein
MKILTNSTPQIEFSSCTKKSTNYLRLLGLNLVELYFSCVNLLLLLFYFVYKLTLLFFNLLYKLTLVFFFTLYKLTLVFFFTLYKLTLLLFNLLYKLVMMCVDKGVECRIYLLSCLDWYFIIEDNFCNIWPK